MSGGISDPIRRGEIPAELNPVRPEEFPSHLDVVFGSGQGLGAGATRSRDGTIPDETAHQDHVMAVIMLNGALERLNGALELAVMHTDTAAELAPAAVGTGTGGMNDWISGLRQELSGRVAEVQRAQGITRTMLEQLG
jgi:hypothetical protein